MAIKLWRFAILFLIFSSCKPEKENSDEMLFFDHESILKKEGDSCEQPENQCTVISLDYPVAEGPEEVAEKTNNSIEEHIIDIVSSNPDHEVASVEQLVENFMKEYKNTARDFPMEPAWEAYITGRIYSKSPDLISIGITSEIFKGGAHGYRGLSFLNFNPNTGELYTKEDLFTPQFKNHVEKIFRKEQGIPSEENINSMGFWFENDTFDLPQNIGFEDGNVLLVYNAYEIAPYAAGDFLLEIKMEDVKPYLKLK